MSYAPCDLLIVFKLRQSSPLQLFGGYILMDIFSLIFLEA